MPSLEAKVKSIITNSSGSLLLVHEYREQVAGLRWNVISGTIEVGVEDVVEAAVREAREEAGVSIRPAVLGMYAIGRTRTMSTGGAARIYVPNFVIRGHTDDEPRLASAAEQAARGEHITAARWFTRHEVGELTAQQVVGGFVIHLLQEFYLNPYRSAGFFLRVYEAD